ncbi:hypothetical protein SBA3_1390001 [Candidatus Sulfopaludibacter sp. SbA3]|nr:hypothetical protein SBA3_1390001 [Candidatus Sulfopaludibacter sp. SbA3]
MIAARKRGFTYLWCEGRARVAVLSYRLWQRRFSGAAGAVGSSIRLNGESFVIAGILPPTLSLASPRRGRVCPACARPGPLPLCPQFSE